MNHGTFISILFFLFNISTAFSQTTKTAKTGNWSNAGTWTPSGVPASNDSIIIPAGIKLTVDVTDTAAAITFLGDKVLKPDTLTINTTKILTITNSINVKQYKEDTSSTVNITGLGTLITDNLYCGTSGLIPTTAATSITLNLSITNISISRFFKIYNQDYGGGVASVPTVNVKTPCNLTTTSIELIQTGSGNGGSRLITFLTETGTTINLSGDSIPIFINSEVTLKTGKVVFTINTASTINFNGNQRQVIPVTISNTGTGGTTNTIPINYGNIKINNPAGASLGEAVTSTNVT